jgi:outer membrane protein assembly factor BamB
MFRSVITLLCSVLLAGIVAAENWPGWRGADGQGHCAEKNLPLKWSATENVKWKVPLPDSGNSTPVIWGDRIFLTQATQAGKVRSLLSLNRADGKQLWKIDVSYPDKEQTHGTNPYCSASPATDGERVVVSHGSAGMFCYDFAGKELWKVNVGKLDHIWGNASSPVLYGDLAVLWCGPGPRQFLLAVDKKTGKEVWKHDEPGGSVGSKGGKDWIGSWSTPIIVKINGTDQLLLSVPRKLKGFDPKSGKELWSCDGLTDLVYTSPLYGNGVAVAMSGYGGSALAVKVGGSGDITKDRLWHHPRNTQRVGSGVIVGEHAYILEENGTPHCFELTTGKEIWKAADRPSSTSWSSMVAAEGRLYVVNKAGDTLVFAASPKYELLATNRLGEGTVNASIAFSNGELYIRTYKHLWCISERKQ